LVFWVHLCINFDTRLSLLLLFSFLVVRLTTINAISAFFYQHYIGKFDSETRWGLLNKHYVIVFVSDLQQVGGSLHKQMTITSCCSSRTFNLELWLHLWYKLTNFFFFSIINFLIIDSNKSTTPVDEVYISQFMQSNRTCSLYWNFLQTPSTIFWASSDNPLFYILFKWWFKPSLKK
jgi:hypothetical protein